MNKISLISSVILISTFSLKTMAAPINLYCEARTYVSQEHIFISFDIKSKEAFQLLGYDHTYLNRGGSRVQSFHVNPTNIYISTSNGDTHTIDRVDLSYTYKEKHDPARPINPFDVSDGAEKYSCTKKNNRQF
jgi:hypothetical protein